MNSQLPDFYKNQISYFSQQSRIYFDSSSFTLINDQVLEEFTSYYKSGGSRALTGLYPGTSYANVTIENCRQALKKFLDIKNGEIAFPQSKSIAILQILYSYTLNESVTIFPYSGLDHDIWLPIFEFSNQNNHNLVALSIKNTINELSDEIKSKFSAYSNKKYILILPYIALGNGLLLTKEFLHKLKQTYDVSIILDCTNAVGISEINFDELSIDAAVFDSNIGLGGPIGSGILYLTNNPTKEILPYVILGNGTINSVKSTFYKIDAIPQRLESAINPAILAGLSKSLSILKGISLKVISNHVQELKNHFFEKLSKFPEIKLLGSENKDFYHNIIGFVVPNINMHEIAMYLDEVHTIDIRSGSFCAHQLTEQLYSNSGLKNSNLGILQMSFHYYNTKNDVENLFMGIREFLNIFK
jgi:selenocysteine lyase/cysteine desulfurase